MEIGIDALPLMGRGGISRHLVELLPALLDQDSGHRYHLFARVFRRARWRLYREATLAFDHPALRWHRVPIPDRVLELAWTHHDLVLPGTRRRLKGVDVFFDTTGLVPAGTPCPIVSVVHDLAPLRFPQWYRREHALVLKRLKKQVSRSSLIIAVSESTRRDLQDFLEVPEENIRVVHHGIHPRFDRSPSERVDAVLRARQLTRPYFLYVGGFGAVKNVRTLLEGFRRFRRRPDANQKLLLAGNLRWAPNLPSEIESLGLNGEVRLLGFTGDDELVALYSGATAVVLSSWYESFGFPALESMACGTPVVSTRVGALPELLGDNALFFAPDRPSELAEHLARIASDEGLRRELGRRGRKHASAFTWERAARQTLAVLQDAQIFFEKR